MTGQPAYIEDGLTIVARVIRQEGHFSARHQVGDEATLGGKTVDGAEFPWLEDRDVSTHACPDAWNPVVFELRGVRE